MKKIVIEKKDNNFDSIAYKEEFVDERYDTWVVPHKTKKVESVALPVVENSTEYYNMRVLTNSAVSIDFFVKYVYDYIQEQTGADKEKIDELIGNGLCENVSYGNSNSAYLNYALYELMKRYRGSLFATQIELAKNQGLKETDFVFYQDYDQVIGDPYFYDIKGRNDSYTRHAGEWYWHPYCTDGANSDILARKILNYISQKLGNENANVSEELHKIINPSYNESDSYRKRRKEKFKFNEEVKGKTVGEVFMTALGEYLMKFKDKNPEFQEIFDKSVKDILHGSFIGTADSDDCYAVINDEGIVALALNKKVATEIKELRKIKDEKVVKAIEAFELFLKSESAKQNI